MRILVVAATLEEVSSLESLVLSLESQVSSLETGLKTYNFELLITGVGMVATAFALGKHLTTNHYDLVLNLGICGSFDRNIALGELVEISNDTIAELGAEDDTNFLPIAALGFGEAAFEPSTQLSDLYNLFNNFNLKKVAAITVNTVHGNEASIQRTTDRLHPQVESMEGAAFFYACRQMNVPCIQIRAVSNYVEKRNRDNWQIGLAIKNLNNFALEFVRLYA